MSSKSVKTPLFVSRMLRYLRFWRARLWRLLGFKGRTAWVYAPECGAHFAAAGHPESPDRIRVIEQALKKARLWPLLQKVRAPEVADVQLARVHSRNYLFFLESKVPTSGSVKISEDTYLCADTLPAARFAAGAAVKAVDMVMRKQAKNAFCAVRPPGHHAHADKASGFCFLNNAAIAAMHAIGTLTIFGIMGGEYVGFSNFTAGDGPFLGNGAGGHFLTILGVFLIAGFSFQGTELIGVTAGETENPEKSIPKAVKQIFWRILIFYILAILVIGLLIPHTSEELLGADIGAGAENIAKSPFTLVFERAGFAFAAAVMNAVILSSVLSAGNSGMYASVRMLYAMGKDGLAWPVFARTSRSSGVPLLALAATAAVIFALFLLQLNEGIGKDLFDQYIIAASGLTGFIAWLGIAVSHYRFRRAFIAQGRSLSELSYRAKWFPFGPLLALTLCVLVIIGQDTDLVLKGDLDWKRLAVTYMGIPVFLAFYLYHKLRYRTHKIPLQDIDLRRDAE